MKRIVSLLLTIVLIVSVFTIMPVTTASAAGNAPKFSVKNVVDGMKISWNPVRGVYAYRVYYKSSNGWTRITQTTGTSYTYKNVSNNKKYTYTVRGVNRNGSFATSYNTSGVSLYYYNAPNMSVANYKEGVRVTWNAIPGISYYRVYRHTSTSSWGRIIDRTDKTSYVDSHAESNTDYWYTVRAVKGADPVSDYRAGVKVHHIETPNFNLNTTATGVNVSWNAVKGASKYVVYHKDKNNNWERLFITNNTSYLDETVPDNTSQTYTVRAMDSNGNLISDHYGGKTITFHLAPQFELKAEKTGIRLTWSKISGAVSYCIYRKNSDGRKASSGTWVKVATTTNLSYFDTSISANGTYTYTMYAIDKNNRILSDGLTKTITISNATVSATEAPTEKPTQPVTEKPTEAPTQAPTKPVAEKPTTAPTEAPTQVPTQAPTQAPTVKPTEAPAPTEAPNYQYKITNVNVTKWANTYYYDNDNYPTCLAEGYEIHINAPYEIKTFRCEFNKNNEMDEQGKLVWHNIWKINKNGTRDQRELCTSSSIPTFSQKTYETKYNDGDIFRVRIFGTDATVIKGVPYNQITPTVETSFTWNENEFASIGNKYRNDTPAKDIPLSEYTIRDEEREMLDWINEYRRKQSFKDGNPYRNELTLSPALCRIARMRAEALADNWDESHVVEGSHDVYPYGSLIATVNKYCGHDTRPIVYGENIASYAGMPYNAVYGWASHESHYLTMVNANYDVAGIGYCEKKGIWVFITGAGATWQDQDEDNENYQAWMARMPLNAQYPVNFWDE